MADGATNGTEGVRINKGEIVLNFLRSEKYKDSMTNPDIVRTLSRIHKTSISEQYVAGIRKDWREGKYNTDNGTQVATVTQKETAVTPTPPAPAVAASANGSATELAKDNPLAVTLQTIKEVHALSIRCGGLDNLIHVATELKSIKAG